MADPAVSTPRGRPLAYMSPSTETTEPARRSSGQTPQRVPTAELLLDAAEELFGRSSIPAVTTREIVEAAGQRNVSSISYHFGSREGLVTALLARRGLPVDTERGRMRALLGDAPQLRDLIACLVVPQAALLHQSHGRSYIRIVAQLRGRYAYWRLESDADSAHHMLLILDEIEGIPAVDPELRRERVVSMIMLMTASTAERARRLELTAEGADPPELSHGDYVSNLIDMCAAVMVC